LKKPGEIALIAGQKNLFYFAPAWIFLLPLRLVGGDEGHSPSPHVGSILATAGLSSFREARSRMDMTMMIRKSFLTRVLAIAFLAGGIALVMVPGSAGAEDLSAQQIIDGLKVSRTRSLSDLDKSSLTANDLAFVKRVRGQTRSLTLEDRDQMAAIVAKRPKVDLDINFDYNSAAVTAKVAPQLKNLGKALTSAELAGSVFMLGGHTDAKGSDLYNQGLSERRAETVKRFLIENYHIPAANLVSAGYGKQGLKNPADPFAAENRRVQVSNVAARDEASR
jgi:outer membrane protein OmpA-like peptidoglycan-associated protein